MDTQNKLKIFFIDDDTFLLNMYAVKFTKNNFEVNTALSAGEAYQKLKDGYVPDIILLDIVMPGMDGIELLEKIRGEKLTPKATVIMLTNQSDTNDIERAKKLGINGYIVKATTIPSEVIAEVSDIHKKAHN